MGDNITITTGNSILSALVCGTAVTMSWIANQSIIWAILHFIIAPFYIPYWILIHYMKLMG